MFRCNSCGTEFNVRNPDSEAMYRCPDCGSYDTDEDIQYLGDCD